MSKSASLGSSFVIAVLLVAGTAYWVVRERSHSTPPPKNVAEAPGPAVPVENPQPTGEHSPPPPPENSPPAPKGNSMAKSSAEGQGPVPSVQNSPPPSSAPQPTQGTGPAQSSSTALAVAIPAEDKMTPQNRRQVQEALQRRGFYQGALDGIFGPATRSAIRRYQESIGTERTGHLTETEASRLVSGT
jgi:hypothetical protein